MTDLQNLHLQMRSLAIFRKLLKNNVLQKLDNLLKVNTQNLCDVADALAAFTSALYIHTDNFSDYLLKAVLDSENVYIKACCANSDCKNTFETALEQELDILQNLSMFDATPFKALFPANFPLPIWKTEAHDFKAIYHKRIYDLPRIGYGIFAKYNVFTIKNGVLSPVKHPDSQVLGQLSDYERERSRVIANTKALLENRPANNVLLYGDAGTGKSSTIKAVANEFFKDGLRLIEVKKNQLYQIPDIVDSLSDNPLKFILFIDDLSFSSNDDDFAALKAILEGSVSNRGANLAVYATSNRRHLVKESFSDRDGDEIHLGDTIQELMSLSARFGLKITYSRPDKNTYNSILQHLAQLYEIEMDETELLQKAEAFALRNGGRSPRCAKQFIELLKGEV